MPPPQRANGDQAYAHYPAIEQSRPGMTDADALSARLIVLLGVWFDPVLFSRLPFLLPHVVRDNSCRGRRGAGNDQWSSADESGFLRDDNSLVKALRDRLPVRSEINQTYRGRALGKGFVASHVWASPKVGGSDPPEYRDAWTNSFIPNLVWLPTELARLSDQPGSFVQRYLRRIAYALYRDADLPGPLSVFTDRAWRLMPLPNDSTVALPDLNRLSFFDYSSTHRERQIAKIARVRDTLASLKESTPLPKGRLSSRYRATIVSRRWSQVSRLHADLDTYLKSCGHRD